MMKYIVDRLKERSTWLGLIGLVCSAGVNLDSQHAQAIATVGTVLAGFIATITPDKK